MLAAASRPRSPAATVAVVCLALFMALLDSTAISLILPIVHRDLGADMTGLVWVADGYVLVFAVALLSSGSLGDRLGRVPVFRVGTVVFAGGSLLCAVAGSLPALVAGRMVQGLGSALVGPQTLAILAHAFPHERTRSRVFGIWSGVSGLALLLGPVVGGTLAAHWGWRSVFLVNLPVGLLTLALGARYLPAPQRRARPPGPLHRAVDVPGQVLVMLALGTLTYALVEGARQGWTATPIVAALGCAGAALVGLVLVESRAEHPMLHLELFRSRNFAASTAAIALVAFGMYAAFFLISLFLQQVQGYTAAAAGVRFLPAMVAVVGMAPLAGLLTGRVGPRPPVLVGTLLIAASLLLLARLGADLPYARWWPLLVTFGAGIGMVMSSLNNALVGHVDPELTGLASATGETGRQVGALVGIAVLGALVIDGFARVVVRDPAGARMAPAQAAGLARELFAAQRPATDTGGLVARALTVGIHSGLTAAGVAVLCATAAALLIRRYPTGPPGRPRRRRLGPAPDGWQRRNRRYRRAVAAVPPTVQVTDDEELRCASYHPQIKDPPRYRDPGRSPLRGFPDR